MIQRFITKQMQQCEEKSQSQNRTDVELTDEHTDDHTDDGTGEAPDNDKLIG